MYNPNDMVMVCDHHHKQHLKATRLLPVVNFFYYVLFIPLMMIPVVGWIILIQLGNYKERLYANQIPSLK